jgi:thiol:disulfide interchange protein DsbD
MTVWIAVSRFLAGLALGAAVCTGAAAAPVKTAHLEAELVAQGEAAPGGETYVALVQTLEPGWHSYWRNPGSAGEATSLQWTLPEGWSAGDIVWATPTRIPVGPLVSFGYEGKVVLPVPVTVPADARPGSRETLKAEASFLVCKEICIPAQASLSVDLVVSNTPAPDPRGGPLVADALAQAPKPAGLAAVTARDGGKLRLAVTGAALKAAPITKAFFFPFDAAAIDAAAAQGVELGPDGLTLTLTPQANARPTPLSGVLALGDRAYEITAQEGPLPAGAAGSGALKPATADEPGSAPGAALGLPLALLFAFVGGLILNLMPCVLPILWIKGAQLAAHAHDPRAARVQGIAFLVGCLLTFLVIAGAMLALRAAGAEIGWGFQLQSPAVVAVLALVMLLVALNLAGLFEVGTSVQGIGGGLAERSGAVGAFFTGVLAVVVAAPCTAPFMAAALGYAISQPAPAALAAFAALGLGFALPFTLLSFAPGLLRRLPRMGTWMTTFRVALAFPMLGAAAWMAWVLSAQGGPHALAALLAAALVLSFAAWLFGLGQKAFGAWTRVALEAALPVGVLVAAAILVPALGRSAKPASAPASAASSAALVAVPWSPEAVAGRKGVVFVDFTAAWCITCQVNESVALSSPAVAETFAKAGAVYMKADWTSRDPVITRALAAHGRAGVPLYLVYPAKGEPKVLPQLLSEGLVREAIENAAG